MSVIRVAKTDKYTIMSNYHFKEKEMSLKAKGLLSLMLSLPDNWDYTISGLATICKENESAIKSALNELKKFNYLEVVKNTPSKENGGRIDYEYIIYEKPKKEIQGVEIQGVEIQGVEIQGVEIQAVENQGQLNTNILNTNKQITKELSTNIYSDIISYLNERSYSHFKDKTPKTRALINARVKEGFSLDDFKKVIDNKCNQWLNDKKMEKYLRPETLFGTHFESYLNERDIKEDGKMDEQMEFLKGVYDGTIKIN